MDTLHLVGKPRQCSTWKRWVCVDSHKQINVIFSPLGADYPCLTSFRTSGDWVLAIAVSGCVRRGEPLLQINKCQEVDHHCHLYSVYWTFIKIIPLLSLFPVKRHRFTHYRSDTTYRFYLNAAIMQWLNIDICGKWVQSCTNAEYQINVHFVANAFT